jgi:hypothetical protein
MIDLNGSVKVSAGVLLCAFLVLPLFSLAVSTPDRRPGYGYAGRIEACRASPELKAKMAKFGMTAGRFVRQTVPDGYLRQLEKFTLNEIPYLLYAPKPGPKPVPIVVYFGGTGEQGSYPGRFAASVPISSIQSPLRIPEKAPGNYWMIYWAGSCS